MRSLILTLALIAPAYADPPPGTDLNSPLHAWFERQHSVAGGWCCDLGDGKILDDDDWRGMDGHYQVRIDAKCLPIADDKLRDTATGGRNPTGHAIVWYRSFGEYTVIYCF